MPSARLKLRVPPCGLSKILNLTAVEVIVNLSGCIGIEEKWNIKKGGVMTVDEGLPKWVL